jgi:hypothetical protein
VPVCKVAGTQSNPQVVSDGSGGAIVVWEDLRDPSGTHIYAQHLNSTGVPLWPVSGVLLCGAAGSQNAPMVTSDQNGGAIVVWTDTRGGSQDLYAQRINSAGATVWTANGVLICGAAGVQDQPSIVSDAASGAIIMWRDQRGANPDIYAQRITSAGTTSWTADGVAVCAATGTQDPPSIIADGVGGAIATWSDRRGANADIYVQRLNASGVAQWTANGVSLCAATGDQTNPRLCPDGANGAIVAWEDRRGANADVYAGRVNNLGAPQWTANGVVVCNATGDQTTPSITADPVAGALIAWSDLRTPANGNDIFVQRFSLAGVASWTANGVSSCDTLGNQVSPTVLSDGMGGALMAWRDFRSGGTADIYGQRVDTTGAIPAQCSGSTSLTANTPVTTAAVDNAYYDYTQSDFYWAGLAVRPATGSDWDVELYQGLTMGNTPYPICWANSIAGSYQSGATVDYIVGDFNPGYVDIPASGAVFGIRANRYSGTGTATIEWDAGTDVAGKDCSNCGAKSSNNWQQVIDVWDCYLFAGQPYTFEFLRTGTGADIRFALFAPSDSNIFYIEPRSARQFETTNHYTVFTPKVNAWHGLVFTNENNVKGTYTVNVTTGTPTTSVNDGPSSHTGLHGVMPNPAHGETRIQFSLAKPGDVSMTVLDMAGRRVAEVPTRHWGAGSWTVPWDGRGLSGRALSPGVYFVEMSLDGRRVGQARLALLR